jgi:hypothetical protein
VTQAREAYRDGIADLAVEHFKFIDESGANMAMTRAFGRKRSANDVIEAA